MAAVHRTAQSAQTAVDRMLAQVRASPVVHADETGWRQDGNNGYVWTFSTPTHRYFLRRGRGKAVVDEALSDSFSGVLVSDFYAAYHHYDGPKQRCWVHPCSSHGQALLRDIHDLRALYHDDAPLARWPTPSTGFTTGPKPSPIPSKSAAAPPNWPWNGSCSPSASLARTTRQGFRPSCADASSATSRNCSSSWPNRRCHRTTTPPSAACATWSSAARSAAALGRNRAPTEQDDPRLLIRHLARPRTKSPRRLPTVARRPTSLNCYLVQRNVAKCEELAYDVKPGWACAAWGGLGDLDALPFYIEEYRGHARLARWREIKERIGTSKTILPYRPSPIDGDN